MQAFLRTPWNATSRTTAQDAPCDSTSWTGTQVANRSWPLALAKSWTGSPEAYCPNEPGAEGRPTHAQWAEQYTFHHRETDQQNAWPPRPKPPTAPQKSEHPREKGGPLTCSPYKQFGGSSGSSSPEPAFSLQREYLTVVARGVPLGGSWSRLPWLSYTSRGRKP